ncbi:formate dehydrogenase subunit gamma [Streptomyces sp. NPDC019208]|uniref:formate dehydrogenase subunit gamma n=1 Tax=unclassified Streptomyces TaxID=2593676 RepID=UPI0033DEDF03
MAVLPGPSVGPPTEPSPEGALEDRVRAIVAGHRGERGALLPVLHSVKEELGYVDPAVIPVLAAELNLSRADVHGVVTFYEDFREAPPGRRTVRICRAEACQAVGAAALADRARRRLRVSFGETTTDGEVTLDQVFCLGNCALGPAVEVDGRLHGRVTIERLDAFLTVEGADA